MFERDSRQQSGDRGPAGVNVLAAVREPDGPDALVGEFYDLPPEPAPGRS